MFGLFGSNKDKLQARQTPEAESSEAKGQRSRICEIGWLVDAQKATFIYGAPRQLTRKAAEVAAETRTPGDPGHPKSVNVCPAVIDNESRTYEVPCPVDINISLKRDDKGQLKIANNLGVQSPISTKHLSEMVHLIGQQRWRDPRRPVVQISAPYRFIVDETCYMSQLPAYGHYRSDPIPGTMITGRLPIHIWPRSLMWAIEWHDVDKPLVLRRGEPWFYVRFELPDAAKPIRLVQAEMTPELREYCNGLDAVTNYVGQTFQLFSEAESRRPEKLLTKKKLASKTTETQALEP